MKDLNAHNQKILDKIVDKNYPTSPKFHDLSGQTLGRLKIDHYVGKDKNGNIFYYCHCKCGNDIIVQYSSLSSGVTTSCGCAHADIMRKKLTTHGLRYHPLYKTWCNMLSRCYNLNNQDYDLYGGKGIKVCDEWNSKNPEGFKNFHDFMINNGWKYEEDFKKKLTIDRYDSDLDYCPENCRVVTMKVQGNNTSRNAYLQLNNYVFTEAIWSEITGINPNTIHKRKLKGWTDAEVLCTPLNNKDPNPCIIYQIPEKYLILNQYNKFCDKGLIQRDPNYT